MTIKPNIIWLVCGVVFSAHSFVSVAQEPPRADLQIPTAEQTAPQNRVIIRALDKITARITEHELEIGQEMRFGTLALVARYCRTRPPIEPPETFAYLEIDDVKRGGQKDRVFEGWMVASSPALNALEHPVYDVWVINCKMVDPETSSPLN
ncbi:MAG: DUF2155 domain-containing protein [Kordiimonadaceae bacterium]|nr:DUF2155 domain-containing protein [Kordiimonadaceae bacterium]